MLTTWYKVFLIGYKWICAIEVAKLFLMLASEMIMTDLELDKALKIISSSLQIWAVLLSLFFQFAWWNKNH